MDKFNYYDSINNSLKIAHDHVKFKQSEYDIKSIYNTKTKYNYGNIFYENNQPKWISISFTFASADGEFREFFADYGRIHEKFKNNVENLKIHFTVIPKKSM